MYKHTSWQIHQFLCKNAILQIICECCVILLGVFFLLLFLVQIYLFLMLLFLIGFIGRVCSLFLFRIFCLINYGCC